MDAREVRERTAYIRKYDPEEAERLEKLLEKAEMLTSGNVYGERFTQRQLSLVVEPLVAANMERVRVLEFLSVNRQASVRDLSEGLGMTEERVFGHAKELLRRNLVVIVRFVEREAVFARVEPGR